MADSIPIEETNKIRVAIGLKPLPVPGGGPTFKEAKDADLSSEEDDVGSTLESRQAQGYGNWKKFQQEAEVKARREAKNEAIKRARDAARRFSKLEGKGLGEADEATEVDTKTWLIQQKKRQKKLEKARRLEKELAERDQPADYTAEDLAGVKVGHELGEFKEGEEQVLTLKDTTIDENEEEGDELENVDLREKERLGEKLELKKRKPVYDPHAANDSGEKSILAHYDEDISGKKRKRFTLDGMGRTAEEREALEKGTLEKPKSLPISLDIVKESVVSDYKDSSEVRMRKSKKKAKSTRQRLADDDDISPTAESTQVTEVEPAAMDVDITSAASAITKKRRLEDTSFADDDDLQALLALQRRAALKQRKKTRPEDIARQVREEESATPAREEIDQATQEGEEPGLVIDETSEFVTNLRKPNVLDRRRGSATRAKNGVTVMGHAAEVGEADSDVDMEQSYNAIDDEKREAEIRHEDAELASTDMTSTGLGEESTLDRGIGATLGMLSQRGLIKTSGSGDLNALHRERQRFLAEKQKREAEAERRARFQRERDRASGKLDRMSAREREEHARFENKHRDQLESRQMAEIFNREYKPDVELKYTDEYGRSMNQKEAFKHLSHQFHGKGSGKQKTEKYLKKIEDEKKREAMSTLDSSQSTGMNNAMGATARKNRQAGVRLA
ncbi:MAG: hypothetical protein M1835_003888 [Candelina submexicana]|nr:MAG: hypothetical protein M1835_003888 [Candelina submexicana]